jgi:hypothetical protein
MSVKFNVGDYIHEAREVVGNKKVCTHVLWFNGESMESVALHIGCDDPVAEGLESLKQYFEGFAGDAGVREEDVAIESNIEPGCNLYIIRIKIGECLYQFNAVEIN